MSFSYHIIANLQSGSGKGKKVALTAEDFFHKRGLPCYIYQTEYPGHAMLLVKKVVESLAEKDRLLVIGGDGTLHEVVTGLKKMDSQLPIGYLPAGTGNDFARSIGLPKSIKKNLQQMVAVQDPTVIECLVYHDREHEFLGVALNSLGFGFDGKVIEAMQQQPKKKGVFSAFQLDAGIYLSTLMDAFKNRQPLDVVVTVDGVRHEFSNILVAAVMNHPYFGGGIKIDPESSSNNHELAVMMIQNLSFLQLMRLLPKAITTGGHIHSPYFQRFSGKTASIKLKEAAVGQVDGEFIPQGHYHFHFELADFLLWK